MQDFIYNTNLTEASQELLNKCTSNLPVGNDLIYNVFVIVKRSVAKSKTLVNFKSLCCNIDMSIFFIVFKRANCSSK